MRYQLKAPYRDGTTHVIFEPLDFIARLAALVPKPRVNLTRFHGVFAPNSKHRAALMLAERGKGNKPKVTDEGQEQTPAERRYAEYDVQTRSMCREEVETITRFRLPGEGGNRNQIQRWCRGNWSRSGRRLIQLAKHQI